ncbi:hypothetical protein [Botryobacter ruber]|uniref:hypothetical protein n=1 Tax=Botryobacter ruber TaxID=2171629 RepID=UPI000E0CA025|nr:hypothetical protein [Botryobacter ruber]
MKEKLTAAGARGVKLKLLLLSLLCLLSLPEVRAQDVISVGPMLHFNFGDRKPKVSWGVEAALWWYQDSFPASVNLGFDRRKGSTVLFAQAQTGVGVAGVAAGPYLELQEGEASVGMQTDYWINYFAGLNYRIRYGTGNNRKALGFYVKAPIPIGPQDEENGNVFDWDWD